MDSNLVKTAVDDLLEQECPVIELNTESHIKKGNNIQVLGRVGDTVPRLIDAYLSRVGDRSDSPQLIGGSMFAGKTM